MAMRDTTRFTFRGTNQEVVDHLKWCRKELGERGRDWDFVGSGKSVEIMIKPSAGLTFYVLRFGPGRKY